MEIIVTNTQANQYKITWSEIITRANKLDKSKKYYGVPRGGQYIAALLNPVDTINEADYIIDDLIDSGSTQKRYSSYNKPFIALFNKQNEIELKNKWLVFPWEVNDNIPIEDNIIRILEYIGENPNREGLIETPKRIVKMYNELYYAYKNPPPDIKLFKNGSDGIIYDQMIIDSGDFYSTCEHHMLPFFGKYYFAYIPKPDGLIIGLSKIARIVNYFAAKLQIQERLGSDIVNYLDKALNNPLGIGIILKAEHLCKTMRGVKKQGLMTTAYLKGMLLNDINSKNEFLSYCK